ncbi:hypothetical protein ACLX1H_000912 [Fusarium chlamydosporum]
MSIQSPNILPPPGISRPDLAKFAKEAASQRIQNPWFNVPVQRFTIGFHDPESDEGPDRFFAWDNEREPYEVQVPRLEAQGRPVSNGEYARYLVDLSGTNSGFYNFHPTSVTHKDHLCGLGDTGGAAEWTKSLFAPQPGFKPMYIYPGYSADFMDEKHLAVVGGSWALHPRIAGRKSFLNWWQTKYFWPWVTFRLVRDVQTAI